MEYVHTSTGEKGMSIHS